MKKRSNGAKIVGSSASSVNDRTTAVQGFAKDNSAANQNAVAPPTAAARSGHDSQHELGVAAVLSTFAQASVIVVAYAYVAAYAVAEGHLAAWNLDQKSGDFTQAELIRGGLIAANAALYIAAASAFALSVAYLVARKFFPMLLARVPTSERTLPIAVANTTLAFGLAALLVMIAVQLFASVKFEAETKAKQQTDFLVVKNAGVEYVVVYAAHGTAVSYVYDRANNRLCSEIQLLKLDEKFHAVREHLGLQNRPTSKQNITDSCGRPLR